MKFRHSMTWLHTWVGLVLSLLLYFMFVTGSAGYFDEEITRWMQPEIPMLENAFEPIALIPVVEQRRQKIAPNADHVYIQLPVGRSPFFSLWWHIPKNEIDGGWHSEKLDPNTGLPVTTRHTEGGELLYRLHYNLHYIPTQLGNWLTSVAAMFMLVAIITGVIIHRRIFKDFFNFRRRKSLTSWLDMHNLLGVLPLPFHLMITYSGLVLLMFSTMIAIPVSNFGTGKELRQAYDAVFSEPPHRNAAGIDARAIPLVDLYRQTAQTSDNKIAFISIDNPGDRNAVVHIGTQADSGLDEFTPYLYDGVSGERLNEPLTHATNLTGKNIYDTLEALHEGMFASPLLRWLYFLSGLMGAGMIASGTVLWILRRQAAYDKIGMNDRSLYVVERLTIGTLVGLPIAIVAYFYANRLLPADLASRSNWEINSLFMTWLATLAHPFLSSKDKRPKQLWREQLLLAAVLYAGVPPLNTLTSNHNLITAVLHGDWVMAGFDLFMLILAASFASGYYKLRKTDPIFNTTTIRVIRE